MDDLFESSNPALADALRSVLDYSGTGLKVRERSWRIGTRRSRQADLMEDRCRSRLPCSEFEFLYLDHGINPALALRRDRHEYFRGGGDNYAGMDALAY